MRLIDADAFRKVLSKYEMIYDRKRSIDDFSYGATSAYEHAGDLLDEMPTVKTFTLADIEEQYRKGMEKGLEEAKRPHGEWEFVQRGKFVDMICPFCKDVCVDGIAYNYSIDEVKEIIESDTFSIHGKQDLPNFCSNCGADMRPKEGEGK